MSRTRRRQLPWRVRRALNALWRPEYEVLAIYRSEVARGVKHDDPEFVAHMAAIQSDYDKVYLPASSAIWERERLR